MLEKNYTNPEGIGRFSFSESGNYRAPYKAEGLIVFVVILIAVILEGALVTFALTLMRDWLGEYEDKNNAAMFVSMTIAIVIGVGSLIIFGIAGTIVARVFNGMNCKYSATEEKFVAIIGGDTNVIYYDQVQSIVFTPKYFLGKIKGYDVDITVANKLEHFGVSFRGQYQSEKSTPFYIIKDRLEIIERRRSDEMALYAQQKIGADKPISQNEIDRAHLRKQHESDIFPPNSGYHEKMPSVNSEKPSVTMDSIAPKSTSRPKMAGVSAETQKSENTSMQMPELKAAMSKSAAPWQSGSSNNVQNPKAEPEKPAAAEMEAIAPKSQRPSNELFSSGAENNSESAPVKVIKSSVKPVEDNEEELKKNQSSED